MMVIYCLGNISASTEIAAVTESFNLGGGAGCKTLKTRQSVNYSTSRVMKVYKCKTLRKIGAAQGQHRYLPLVGTLNMSHRTRRHPEAPSFKCLQHC